MLLSRLRTALAVVFVLVAATTSYAPVYAEESIPLAEKIEEASMSFDGGRYPHFVDEPRVVDSIDIDGEVLRCLTPPFPSRLSFDLHIPQAAFFEFSPALKMIQDVRRARIEYAVFLKEGDTTETVYEELFRSDRANRWHLRRVDLTRWSGKKVQLILEVRAVPARQNILWADRLQTVWGEPVIRESSWLLINAQMDDALGDTWHWLEDKADSAGVGPERQIMTLSFAINLVLGGLLAMYIRELYKRFCSTKSNREQFANMLPLFTITTITVVSVVQYSPALALGLIGALSIVRFRVAITTAEELVFLLLCVALGTTLGASRPSLALATVVMVTPFVVLERWLAKRDRATDMQLTLSGDPNLFFSIEGPSVIDLLREMTKDMTIHRLEHEPDRMVCRARVKVESRARVVELLSVLRQRALHCQLVILDGDGSVP